MLFSFLATNLLCSPWPQTSTIGLVTLTEMKAKQEDVVKEREKKLARKQKEEERKRKREIEAKNEQKREEKQKVIKVVYSRLFRSSIFTEITRGFPM